MPRRRPAELQINHERWLVSYADFITLLFAFFVVMYSISQVNESKYRVLSDTLIQAFNQNTPRSLDPLQVGDPNLAQDPSVIDLDTQSDNSGKGDFQGDGAFDRTADLPQLADQFEDKFADLLDDKVIQLHSNEHWLEVELNAKVLFASADAEPTAEAETIFADVAGLLKDFDNPVQVEGFTDNIPINNSRFPSNWELSAARAAAVVKLLMEGEVKPERLSAVGYGEFQPVADNSTEEGRAENRRVVLMIARERSERPRVSNAEQIERAVTPETTDSSQPYPQPSIEQPGIEQSGLDSQDDSQPSQPETEQAPLDLFDEGGADGNEQAPAVNDPQNRLAPVGEIQPVETEEGGLLFSSDPNLPRK